MVLESAVAVGATRSVAPAVIASIRNLRVTANCQCGCATIWFGPEGDAANGQILADARAMSGGKNIGIIVWAIDDAIVGLEFVGPTSAVLPDPSTVQGYGSV